MKNNCLICESGQVHLCLMCKTGTLEYDTHTYGSIICPDCAKKHPDKYDEVGCYMTHVPKKPSVIAKLANKAKWYADVYYGDNKLPKNKQRFLLSVLGLFHLGSEVFYYDYEDVSGARAIIENSCDLLQYEYANIYRLIDEDVKIAFEPTNCKLYAVEWGN